MSTPLNVIVAAFFFPILSGALAAGPPKPVEIVPGNPDAPLLPPTNLQKDYLVLDEVCASYVAELMAAKEYVFEKLKRDHSGNTFTRTHDYPRCDKSHYLSRYELKLTDKVEILYLKCPARTDPSPQATYEVIGGSLTTSAQVIEFTNITPKQMDIVRAMPYRLAPECVRQSR